MILEDLISTNIMQRGVGNVNPMKMAKCIIELERIKGIQNGGNRGNQYKGAEPNNSDVPTQKDLAEDLNIKQDTITNYKKLLNLIPELQQMVENGSMKATVGYKIWAGMPQDEQENIGREKIKTLTQKATQQYINENRELKRALENEKEE